VNSLRDPVALESGGDSAAWRVIVPDLPGGFSAGDTLEEALAQAEDAVIECIEATLDSGDGVPAPTQIELLRASAYCVGSKKVTSLTPGTGSTVRAAWFPT